MRNYCAEVRGHTVDMGAESLVGNMPDVISAYLVREGLKVGDVSVDLSSYMFPNSITVPGHSHLCDTILRAALWSLPFYPEYLQIARGACIFLRNRSNRSALVQALREKGLVEQASSMEHFSARFAAWRFGTQKQVCSSLKRVQNGLMSVWDVRAFFEQRGRAGSRQGG